VVDEVRVYQLLRSVTDGLAALRGEAGAEPSRRADPMWLPGIKYTFVTTIEACVDVAQHFCSSEGWDPLADNGATMTLLARHGVLNAEPATRMRQAVGLPQPPRTRVVLVAAREAGGFANGGQVAAEQPGCWSSAFAAS